MDILKEIHRSLDKSDSRISDAVFEGANIVLYTKDKEFFNNGQDEVRKLVSEFKKRVELRCDPSLALDQEVAEEKIQAILPDEAKADQIIFDPERNLVIIETEKPGVAIGKQGCILREIKRETLWTPLIKRTPSIRSKLIENIRAVLYQNSDYRRKFLHKVGQKIYSGWSRDRKEHWVRLSVLGAGRQVGRSCFLLQTPDSNILLDCGIDPGTGESPYFESPDFDISKIDAVILSHAHLDHVGLLPFLYKMQYKGPVYCTAPTRDIASISLLDFTKIMKNDGKPPLFAIIV